MLVISHKNARLISASAPVNVDEVQREFGHARASRGIWAFSTSFYGGLEYWIVTLPDESLSPHQKSDCRDNPSPDGASAAVDLCSDLPIVANWVLVPKVFAREVPPRTMLTW